MTDVRGNAAAPGQFRRTQNWIGAPGSTPSTATYVPPPADALADCLKDWERFLHDRTLPALVHAGLAHAQFEAIHPFLDGNGRVGRLVITLLLIERGVLPGSPAVPQRLVRGDAIRVLRASARDDPGRRVDGVADLLPPRGRRGGGRRDEAHPAGRRPDGRVAQTARGREVEAARGASGALRRESLLDDDPRRQAARRRVHDGRPRDRPAPGRRHRRPRSAARGGTACTAPRPC